MCTATDTPADGLTSSGKTDISSGVMTLETQSLEYPGSGADQNLKESCETKSYDYVHRPKHYCVIGNYDVCDIANATGLCNDAYMFNVLKYVLRKEKPGEPRERDVRKIREYCDIWLKAHGCTDKDRG